MEPFIEIVMDNERLLKNTLHYGQLMWNKGVAENFPNHAKSKDIEDMFPKFMTEQKNPDLAMIFLTRKRERFNNENFFIIKIASNIKENVSLSISVVAVPAE
ncbi:Uncharacterised protein [Candidatus Venteria ishoeyi]|uniref:Uncharacterized protein n=2 Tax=Candidatus Venteria ishoeyi TaxID=1899563 RepID=A0A1H6F7S1_9GAMM|nr:Uncharacterised protein [Candidatus Venteria ishoeyi]